MKLVEIPNGLGETVLAGTASSGLRVLVNPRPRFAHTFAAFGPNFGSVDRVATAGGQPIPEGLAHFLEHKLFEDERGDVSDRFAALGASTNAMTGFCGTTYVVSTIEAPAACLDLLLDFVQDPWFTDALVAKEQGIIAQDIRMDTHHDRRGEGQRDHGAALPSQCLGHQEKTGHDGTPHHRRVHTRD